MYIKLLVVFVTQAKKPYLIMKYKKWIQLSWVQDVISNTILKFDDFNDAVPYVHAWLNENTYKLYKLISVYGPTKKSIIENLLKIKK